MPATVGSAGRGEDIREMGRSGDADEQRLSNLNLNDLVGGVLPDVDVLGSLSSADDVVIPLDAGRVDFVDRRGRRLGESHTLEELAVVQDLASRR